MEGPREPTQRVHLQHRNRVDRPTCRRTSSKSIGASRFRSPLSGARRTHPSSRVWCRSIAAWSGMPCERSRRAAVATSPSTGIAAYGSKWASSCSDRFLSTAKSCASATPGGAAASTTHFGPYAGLGAAHDAIQRWCEANKHPLAGPSWEIYDHWQNDWNAHPSRIRTDIFYLLKHFS